MSIKSLPPRRMGRLRTAPVACDVVDADEAKVVELRVDSQDDKQRHTFKGVYGEARAVFFLALIQIKTAERT